jgi:hypothetical protein
MRVSYRLIRPNVSVVRGVLQSDRVFKVDDVFRIQAIFHIDDETTENYNDDVQVIMAQHVVDIVGRSTMEEMFIDLVPLPIYDVAKTTEKLNEELHAALKKAEDALDAMAIATMANGANISHAILRVAEELRGLGYDLHATTHGIKSPRKTKP